MKKVFLYLAMLSILAFGIFGCSDDDDGKDNSITGGDLAHIENTDFDFMMGIMAYNLLEKSSHFVMIDSYNYQNPLQSATLVINGTTIDLVEENWDGFVSFWADVTYNYGEQLDCEVNINGHDYDVSLTVPYHPNVTFPAIFNPAVSTEVNWSLEQNSQFQLFEAYGNSDDFVQEDGKYKELSVSSRQYTIPENWISSTLDQYSLAVSEFYADYDGDDLIALAADGETAYYGGGFKQNREIMNKKLRNFAQIAK